MIVLVGRRLAGSPVDLGTVGCLMAIDTEVMRAWLEASCAAQGIVVADADADADAGMVARVGVLLRGGGVAGGRGATGVTPVPSAAPRGHDPERVETAPASLGRGDGGVVEDRDDDRRLTA